MLQDLQPSCDLKERVRELRNAGGQANTRQKTTSFSRVGSLLCAPPVEVLVRVRVKAYPGPHEDRDLNTGRDMSEVPIGKEEKKHQEKKTTQEVTTFTCDNIKRKQYIQT